MDKNVGGSAWSCPAKACSQDRENLDEFYLHWYSAHKPMCPRADCKHSVQGLKRSTKSYFLRHWERHYPAVKANTCVCDRCGQTFANASNRNKHPSKCTGAQNPEAAGIVGTSGATVLESTVAVWALEGEAQGPPSNDQADAMMASSALEHGGSNASDIQFDQDAFVASLDLEPTQSPYADDVANHNSKDLHRIWDDLLAPVSSDADDPLTSWDFDPFEATMPDCTPNNIGLPGLQEVVSRPAVEAPSYTRDSGPVKRPLDCGDMSSSKKHKNTQGILASETEHAQPTAGTPSVMIPADVTRREDEVLQNLEFPGMNRRLVYVDESSAGTFDWTFHDRPVIEYCGHETSLNNPLPEWLRAHNRLFLVRGKAGSGKSTLMKHVSGHEHTSVLLREWADALNCRLVMGNIFFWKAGTHLEKTREGLLRSLLYQVLRVCRDWIPAVLPLRWQSPRIRSSHFETVSWSCQELARAVSKLVVQMQDEACNVCFCFFIDALDEYEGDQGLLVQDLLSLLATPRVKICASSRPRNLLDTTFGGPQNASNLTVHEFTRPDIRRFVENELGTHQWYARLAALDAQGAAEIIEDIQRRAEGVFLWVVLVVKELRKELNELGSLEELATRLRLLPPDLPGFFDLIFDNIDVVYRSFMAKLLLLLLDNDYPIYITAAHFLYEDCKDQNVAFGSMSTLAGAETLQRSTDQAKSRILKWCGDLVVVQQDRCPVTGAGPIYSLHREWVQFSHRSVQDYLQISRVHQRLEQYAGFDFEGPATLCRISLAHLRLIGHALTEEKHIDEDESQVDEDHTLPALAEQIMRGALACERMNKDPAVRVMRILDQVLTDSFQRVLGSTWPYFIVGREYHDVDEPDPKAAFLALVASYGLNGYLRHEMASWSSKERTRLAPYILDGALRAENPDGIPQKHYYLEGRVNIIHHLLFELGISINSTLDSGNHQTEPDAPDTQQQRHTVWGYFVDYLEQRCRAVSSAGSSAPDMIQILQLVIEARPMVQYSLPGHCKSLCSLFVHTLSCYEDSMTDHFEQVRQMMVHSDRVWL
ncbi:hypothetical protein LTR56_011801 [Elasticomyces elasticus]|nr:hypothetical protein LTR22_024349 [Elasticomyces elasticus]KAK3640709.1 hypothetical protein LTR56_011801 [Elasticomyces elasticus]KAK4929010.1 hypothetical protein LTR49_004207 [Elasticomyces elasticus]KAK5750388.1 hypothetical protein LTS12_019574 [Elasticomyces elasticus]